MKSQAKFDIQKTAGLTPAIICTCLALVILSFNGKIMNIPSSRDMAMLRITMYCMGVGLFTPSSPPLIEILSCKPQRILLEFPVFMSHLSSVYHWMAHRRDSLF